MQPNDIQSRKLALIASLAKLEDESLIKMVEQIVQNPELEEFRNQLAPMSHKEYQKMVETSYLAGKSGEVISQQELENEAKNW